MKTSVFLIIVIAVFPALADAQDPPKETYSNNSSVDKNFSLSIGITPSVPVGNFHDLSGFGLGGSLEGEVKAGNKIGFTLNAGFIDYFGKTVDTIEYADFKYWPVMGGLKFYMGSKSYLHGQAGAGFGTEGLGTSFWYGAGIGFNLGRSVDAEFKYTGWKQKEVGVSYNGGGYTPPGGNPGGNPGGSPGGAPPYGGHYSTLDLRLAYKF